MREAAADLEFETAARLRDEIKRLRETELAIADDPLARQSDVEDRAGAFAGVRASTAALRVRRGQTPNTASFPKHRPENGDRTPPPQAPASSATTSPCSRPTHRPPPSPAPASASPTSTRWARPPIAPIPARSPDVDPRTKAGAYGEQVSGPHKPTLDEMGPHAERGLPVADKPVPLKPQARPNSPPPGGEGLGVGGIPPEKKKHRHGRARKTGRPGA